MEGTSARQWIGFVGLSLGLFAVMALTIAWLMTTFVLQSCGC